MKKTKSYNHKPWYDLIRKHILLQKQYKKEKITLKYAFENNNQMQDMLKKSMTNKEKEKKTKKSIKKWRNILIYRKFDPRNSYYAVKVLFKFTKKLRKRILRTIK